MAHRKGHDLPRWASASCKMRARVSTGSEANDACVAEGIESVSMFVRGMTCHNELVLEEESETESAVRRQVGRCNIPRRCANIAEGPSVRTVIPWTCATVDLLYFIRP